jgi:hypothetical protein
MVTLAIIAESLPPRPWLCPSSGSLTVQGFRSARAWRDWLSIGAGKLTESPEAIRSAVADLLADDAALWRAMKRKLALHGRNAGAIAAARHILERRGSAK